MIKQGPEVMLSEIGKDMAGTLLGGSSLGVVVIFEELGEINISDQAIKDLARNAALQTYGVAGLARQDVRTGLLRLARGKGIDRSIEVQREDQKVRLDVFVVIEFGTNLAEVAHNLADKVRYELERYTGLDVSNVDVHVREVKASR